MHVSEYILEILIKHDVRVVFGIPGGAIEPLFNALSKCVDSGRIRYVSAKHETQAVLMASAHAKSTGTLGVVLVTTGPGAINTAMGLADSNDLQTPVLLISAQTQLSKFTQGQLQESYLTNNTLSVTEGVTKKSLLVCHEAQIPSLLAEVMHLAMTAPMGPVHLSIPTDILIKPLADQTPGLTESYYPTSTFIEPEKLQQLFEKLENASAPVLILGKEATEAIEQIDLIAESYGAHVVCTPGGKGAFDSRSPHFCGVFGFAGHQSATDLIQTGKHDLILAIGTEFSVWSTLNGDQSLLGFDNLVAICSNSRHFSRVIGSALNISGNLANSMWCLAELVKESKKIESAQPFKNQFPLETIPYDNKQHPLLPQEMFACAPDLLSENTIFLSDVGNTFAWSSHYLLAKKANTTFASYGFAPVGWAIGSAIGHAIARPESTVVAFVGDGAFLMNGLEAVTAAEEGLSIIYVIFNDASYGMIRHGQIMAKAERFAYALPKVNYRLIGEGLGMISKEVRSIDEFKNAISEYIPGAPMLLDAYIDVDQCPPMDIRIASKS